MVVGIDELAFSIGDPKKEGPAPRCRAGGSGPAAAWYFVYFGISLYVLDIFDKLGYIFGCVFG